MFDFDAATVDALELRFPRDEITHRFRRGEAGWESEAEPIEGLDLTRIGDLVDALSFVEATGIDPEGIEPADQGLEPAAVQLILQSADSTLAELELGDPQAGRGIPARVGGAEGKRVWRVINDLGRDVPLGSEAFRNRWLESAAEDLE